MRAARSDQNQAPWRRPGCDPPSSLRDTLLFFPDRRIVVNNRDFGPGGSLSDHRYAPDWLKIMRCGSPTYRIVRHLLGLTSWKGLQENDLRLLTETQRHFDRFGPYARVARWKVEKIAAIHRRMFPKKRL